MGSPYPAQTVGPLPEGGNAVLASQARAARPGYEAVRTPEDQAIITKVMERVNWDVNNPSRDLLFRQLFEQISFYAGIQWIEYNPSTKQYTRWTAPAWFPTPVSNEISPRVAVMVARILGINPQGRVSPKSMDADDWEAARTAEKLIAHAHDVTDEQGKRELGALYASVMGAAIFKDTFNPTGGKVRKVPRGQWLSLPAMEPSTKCPACGAMGELRQAGMLCLMCGQAPLEMSERQAIGPDGTPQTRQEFRQDVDQTTGQPAFDYIPDGELQSDVRLLFNFYWDQLATTPDEMRWMGEGNYVDLDWIDQSFPEMGPYVPEEPGVDSGGMYSSSLRSMVGASIQESAHQGGGASVMRGGAVLRWYEERPTRARPEGLLAIVANGVLLYKGPLPIQDEQGVPTGDLSWTIFNYDLMLGRAIGRTPVEDMVSPQRRINGIDAQLILNRKTLLNPWILAPKGSGLNPGQVALRPGSTLVYNFIGVGQAPQVVQGTPLPEQVLRERESALETMDRLAQDARISLAEMPQGVKSGTALNFIKEQADMASSPRLARWGRVMAQRDRKRLLLMQRYYTNERSVKVLGQGTDWRVETFKGTDIRGNTDVAVDPGSIIPRSPSARMQTMFDLLEAGGLSFEHPVQRQKILSEMGMSDFDLETGPDWRRAQKEIADLDRGVQVMRTPVDNDELHLLAHLARIKDPNFDYLPPQAKMAHMAHKDMHLAQYLLKMGRQVVSEETSATPPGNKDTSAGPSKGGPVATQPQTGAQATPMPGGAMEEAA